MRHGAVLSYLAFVYDRGGVEANLIDGGPDFIHGELFFVSIGTVQQEALSRKADKAYTKRKMALLVSRVSALLKEESDEPSMAKKCLSCDRAFNKFSFKELEQVTTQFSHKVLVPGACTIVRLA